jgi:hypothetical protein
MKQGTRAVSIGRISLSLPAPYPNETADHNPPTTVRN